jgi:hypothetical protein
VWSPYSSGTDQFQSLVPPTPVAESTFDGDQKCSAFWNTFWLRRLADERDSDFAGLPRHARIKFKQRS